jgi:hypothetical protein
MAALFSITNLGKLGESREEFSLNCLMPPDKKAYKI